MGCLKVLNIGGLKVEFERRHFEIKDNIFFHYIWEIKKEAPYLSDGRIINVKNKRCYDLSVLEIFEKLYKKKKQ